MKFFGFNLAQIVFPVIAFPVIAFGGFVAFRSSGQQAFQPQGIVGRQIEQRQIDQRTVQPQTLSPVSDLKGDWNGALRITNVVSDQYGDTCESDFQMALNIDSQSGNTIDGNAVATWQSGTKGCALTPTKNDPVHGTITGSKLQINLGSWGDFTGSFTSKTMTLNQGPGPGGSQVQPINLLR